MASIFNTLAFSIFMVSTLVSIALSASVIEDLKNLKPPLDFNNTITTNCLNNPSLQYCDASPNPIDLDEIFKFTVVASHLCNESKNPHCIDSFPKIDLRNRPFIAPLYLSFAFFWKYCPLTVLSIDFSNTSLKGGFPIDVLLCTQVRALYLSHNELTGQFPTESFSPLTNLTDLNVSYNNFAESEEVSKTDFFKRFDSSSFIHSGLIPDHKSFRIKLMFLMVGFPIFVITMVGCLGWACLYRPDYLPKVFRRKHLFTMPMLKDATEGFSKRNVVGRTEAVDVYQGTLRDGRDVRIEIYRDIISREAGRVFVQECKVLVRLRHKNIVRVLGWCDNRQFRAVVSEWEEGQDVETWLSESNPPWKYRLRVMKGVVLGMCYLHEKWPEVGYDLSTSSVLLSNTLEPLISRFEIEGHNNTTRRIYKLGLLILEIVANKRAGVEFEGGEAGFINYVRMHFPGDMQKVVDEKMKFTNKAVFEQAKEVTGLGLMCTDKTNNRQLELRHIFDIISRAYESVTFSITHYHNKSSHGRDRIKRNRQIE